MPERISNLNTFADLVDRLIIEINKIAFLEDTKAREHEKPSHDRNYVSIAYWDALSRRAVNLRAQLKNAINKEIETIVEEGEYKLLPEVKTFTPGRPFSEVLADRCHDVGNVFLREEMAQQLSFELHEAYKKLEDEG